MPRAGRAAGCALGGEGLSAAPQVRRISANTTPLCCAPEFHVAFELRGVVVLVEVPMRLVPAACCTEKFALWLRWLRMRSTCTANIHNP